MLAAGASRRLPGPKQLLRFRGATLLRHAARTALGAGLGPVAVVLGAGAMVRQLRFELSDLAVTIVENPRWKEGIGSSIHAGLAALEGAASPAAVLIMTCDQPYVTPSLLGQLADRWRASGAPAVACEYSGTVGVPALFDRALFPELRQLPHDHGAKPVLERHMTEVARIPFEEGALDIDTPDDAHKLAGGR